MSSHVRLAMIERSGATVVCCTPTYALRLAEVAAEEGHPPLTANTVRVLIVAGEPGGSIPATRERIEQSWGARVIDHHGLTEVGPVSFECWEAPGFLHLNEAEYICEVLDPATGAASGRRRDRRAGRHQPRPDRQPGDPLSHRRHRRPAVGAVRVRPHAGRGSRAASWRAPTTWSTSAA